MPNAYSMLVLTLFFWCLDYGTNVRKLNTPTKVRKLKIYDPLPNLCKKEIQKNMFHNTVKVLCHYTDASEMVFLGHYSHDILSFNQIISNNSYFTKTNFFLPHLYQEKVSKYKETDRFSKHKLLIGKKYCIIQ